MNSGFLLTYYLPDNVVTNEELADQFPDVTPEQIFKQSGVRKRYLTNPDEIGSDLACKAAKKLFSENESLVVEEIDLLVMCTLSPDFRAPSTSVFVHEQLGLREDCLSIDVPMGCSGYIYGLSLIKAMITAGLVKNALFLLAETSSHATHSEDLYLRMIFSDGASATYISKEGVDKIGNFVFGTDGKGAKSLFVDRSATRNPVDQKWITQYKDEPGNMLNGRMYMNGAEIVTFAIRRVPKLLAETLEKNNLNFEDIDLFIFHQASGFILHVLRRKCKIPEDKFFVYLEEVGNTVSSSIPIALKEAIVQGKAKRGMKIMLLGYGIGYTWGGTVIKL